MRPVTVKGAATGVDAQTLNEYAEAVKRNIVKSTIDNVRHWVGTQVAERNDKTKCFFAYYQVTGAFQEAGKRMREAYKKKPQSCPHVFTYANKTLRRQKRTTDTTPEAIGQTQAFLRAEAQLFQFCIPRSILLVESILEPSRGARPAPSASSILETASQFESVVNSITCHEKPAMSDDHWEEFEIFVKRVEKELLFLDHLPDDAFLVETEASEFAGEGDDKYLSRKQEWRVGDGDELDGDADVEMEE